jgi:deoxyribodipyrimidine photo-lyase
MRELRKTGYMHNRARLITANFLVRILHVDWKIGERLYSSLLTDYDPCVNNCNWQWVASVGIDTKPHSQRVFNPYIQSVKFDKDCDYIKKWIPELKDIPNKDIHKWNINYHKYNVDYPAPIVDYKQERLKTINAYDISFK